MPKVCMYTYIYTYVYVNMYAWLIQYQLDLQAKTWNLVGIAVYEDLTDFCRFSAGGERLL